MLELAWMLCARHTRKDMRPPITLLKMLQTFCVRLAGERRMARHQRMAHKILVAESVSGGGHLFFLGCSALAPFFTGELPIFLGLGQRLLL